MQLYHNLLLYYCFYDGKFDMHVAEIPISRSQVDILKGAGEG